MDSMSMQRWQGKVAVVTGASSGIGHAVAEELALAGMEVAGVARRTPTLQAIKTGLGAAGERFHPFPADLRKTNEIPALFHRIRQELGGIHVLVNNAGLGHDAPLLSGESDLWREMLEVNVLALCACTREAITAMQDPGAAQRNEKSQIEPPSKGTEASDSQPGGYVIHISSMSGHRVPPSGGVYAATKHAVMALTEALRLELRAAGSSVRVSAISPGFVETEFAEKLHQSKKKAEEVYSRYPCLQPADMARAVMFLLSQPPHVQYHDLLVRPTQQPR